MERKTVIILLSYTLAIFIGIAYCNAFKRNPKHATINGGSSIDFGNIRVSSFLSNDLPKTNNELISGHDWKTGEHREFGYLVIKMNYSSLDFLKIENRFHKKIEYQESEMDYIKTRWAAVYRQFDGRAMPPVSFSDKVLESSWGNESETFEVFGSKTDDTTLILWCFSSKTAN